MNIKEGLTQIHMLDKNGTNFNTSIKWNLYFIVQHCASSKINKLSEGRH